MNFEARIIQLLEEYLKKADQKLVRIDKSYDILMKKHSYRFEKHAYRPEKRPRQFEIYLERFQEDEKEIAALRKESLKLEIRNDALLKEIFSISKRVKDIEEKS